MMSGTTSVYTPNRRSVAHRRQAGYAATFASLFVGFYLLRDSTWRGNIELHTLMETAATLLALNIGILALIRFYSQKDNTFLFIGSGFLGTGFLDGYHALVTSSYFVSAFPSQSASLIPWSWLASRLFLSFTLCLSWWFWKREERLGKAGGVNERVVYSIMAVLTLGCFLFFALVPLPPAYEAGVIFPRPQEFVPAAFFAVALVGYWRKGQWRTDSFEHWLVLALIVSFMSQAMFMSTSARLFDEMFDTAHLLKHASYICVLVGLLINMYHLFIVSTNQANVVLDAAGGSIMEANQRAGNIFGYSRSELVRLDLGALSLGKPPYSRADLIPLLRNAASGCVKIVAWPCRAKDGRVIWIELSPQRDSTVDGYLLTTIRDVTEAHEAEMRFRQERDFSGAVISGLPGVFVQSDERGRIVRCNENLSTVTGLSKEQLHGRDAFSLIAEADRERAQAKLVDLLEKGATEVELGVLTKSGNVREFHWNARLITFDAQPNLLAAGIDITEARAAEMKLRESEERFRTLEKATGQLVWATDAQGDAIDSTDWAAFTGQSSGENLGYGWLDAIHPDDRQQTNDAWSRAVEERSIYTTEYRLRRHDGVYRVMSVRGVPILRQDGTIRDWIGTSADITERSLMEVKLARAAHYDLLTGLPNRATFIERLELAFAAVRRGTAKVVVMFLDLDQFKDVNDTLGHPVGDLLLQAVAKRLQATIREIDTVARFGGDEFAVINSDIGEPADSAELAERILKTLREPFLIRGNDIRIGASIGIAIYGLDATDAETLLSHADVALYRAKAEGRGTYRFFTDAMDTDVRARVKVNAELRDAITSGQLFLMYQPQVNVDTGHIIGVEALVRWQHPTRGMVSPGEFIPVAEKSGLIVALGQWVLQEACGQMKEWFDAGIAPPLVAVNVSAAQFKAPLELENEIAAILAETGLAPSHLELELTETVLMEVSHDRNDLLQRLRTSGLRIAIDDFGTGYSSLEYLGRFPVDRIKIAQNFTLNLTNNPRNIAIMKAAIAMAQELGLDVIVEGVETEEQLKLIRSLSGHKVQGFYFFKPLSAAEVTALLSANQISPVRPVRLNPAA